MKIKIKKLTELSESELGELRKLTLNFEDGDESYMNDDLKHPNCKQKHAIIAQKHGKTIAWALLKVADKYNNTARLYVYVAPELRRQGIGSKLVKEAEKFSDIKWNMKVSVAPWDETSCSFFRKTLGRVR